MSAISTFYTIVAEQWEQLSLENRKLLLSIYRKAIDQMLSAENPDDFTFENLSLTEEENAAWEQLALLLNNADQNFPESENDSSTDDTFSPDNGIGGLKDLNEALRHERAHALEKLKEPHINEKWAPWYKYVFPDADVKEVIVSCGGGTNNPYLIKVQQLSGISTYYYLVFLDSNEKLICKDKGQGSDSDIPYNRKIDDETFAMLRVAELFPIQILPKKEQHDFKVMLGQAHGLRYSGSYELIPSMVEKAIQFAGTRNAETNRRLTLYFATLGVLITMTILIVARGMAYMNLLPAWTHIFSFESCFAIAMGVVGAYASLWMRFRSLAEIAWGGRKTIWIDTTCRLLIGAISAYLATLAVRCGLLFHSLNGQHALGLIGFIFGFSERLIPSFFKRFMSEYGIDDLERHVRADTKNKEDANSYEFRLHDKNNFSKSNE